MSAIILDNIYKRYGGKTALNGLHLTFPAGQISAVVGPSGSGKSTLVQMINGLIRPDSGKISIFNSEIDYHRLLQHRRRIGYALQGTGLFPHLDARRNITLQARVAGWTPGDMQNRVDELADLVNLDVHLLEKYPHQLSGGEQQRVGLCRAMMIDPPVVLLDEVFGALDPITRNEIHREFLNLQTARARTIVLVTHDLREAIKLSDRIFILHQGVLQQSGSGSELLLRPQNSFVEQFFHDQLRDDPVFDLIHKTK